jgi:hypothetical protein
MQLCALELLNQVGIKPVRMEQHLERIDTCQIISVMTKKCRDMDLNGTVRIAISFLSGI